MSHFAALAARDHNRWRASEVSLDDVDDIEDVAELMRDESVDDGPVLLFIEQDDEWFAIVRVDAAAEPKVFISDARVVSVNALARLVFALELPAAPTSDRVTSSDEETLNDADDGDDDDDGDDLDDGDDDPPAMRPDAVPGGATDLLADFGISARELLAMCAEERMLPADVISAVCETLGCAEEIEVYR